jgi:hypothetical protein
MPLRQKARGVSFERSAYTSHARQESPIGLPENLIFFYFFQKKKKTKKGSLKITMFQKAWEMQGNRRMEVEVRMSREPYQQILHTLLARFFSV